MSLLIALKIVHVLAAITAVGASVTYAFWLRLAGTEQPRLLFAIEGVRRLDRLVANPAYIVLLLTGVAMVMTGAYRFEEGWLSAAIFLYVVTAVVGFTLFAPAIRRQQAEAERDPTSEDYAAAARRTNLFGILTVLIVLVIVVLMVAKPF
jgi:uncharacterized membrane protein